MADQMAEASLDNCCSVCLVETYPTPYIFCTMRTNHDHLVHMSRGSNRYVERNQFFICWIMLQHVMFFHQVATLPEQWP